MQASPQTQEPACRQAWQGVVQPSVVVTVNPAHLHSAFICGVGCPHFSTRPGMYTFTSASLNLQQQQQPKSYPTEAQAVVHCAAYMAIHACTSHLRQVSSKWPVTAACHATPLHAPRPVPFSPPSCHMRPCSGQGHSGSHAIRSASKQPTAADQVIQGLRLLSIFSTITYPMAAMPTVTCSVSLSHCSCCILCRMQRCAAHL